MTKSLLLAGSTGSIGTQALKVCEKHNIKVNALSAGSNYKLLAKQAEKFRLMRQSREILREQKSWSSILHGLARQSQTL